eukprot:859668-Amphidinium_carterae.2
MTRAGKLNEKKEAGNKRFSVPLAGCQNPKSTSERGCTSEQGRENCATPPTKRHMSPVIVTVRINPPTQGTIKEDSCSLAM